MKNITKNRNFLTTLFCVCLVVSNVVTGKIVATPFSFFGFDITVPGGFICYAITYLITDILSERYGKKAASLAVKYGFICQIIASALIFLTQVLPPADIEVQNSYERLMGINYALTVASLISYCVSQTLDVFLFHKIKDLLLSHKASSSLRGIWNTASTLASQFADTVFFIGIGFGFGFGWLFEPEKRMLLFATMIGQYIIKLILAILDTPFFYLFTLKKGECSCRK